jgi:hypothetical protein
MIRLLILIAIVLLAIPLVRRLLAKARSDEQPPSQPANGKTEANLVRCGQCGAFVPKTNAVAVTNGYRCAGRCAPR